MAKNNPLYHIVHCSDSDHGDAALIRKWHMEAPRHWDNIGYHFVIRKDGGIEIGRPIAQSGAHCAGFNTRSVGTCIIGKPGKPNAAQLSALKGIHEKLKRMFPNIEACGHRDMPNVTKECPGFNVKDHLK